MIHVVVTCAPTTKTVLQLFGVHTDHILRQQLVLQKPGRSGRSKESTWSTCRFLDPGVCFLVGKFWSIFFLSIGKQRIYSSSIKHLVHGMWNEFFCKLEWIIRAITAKFGFLFMCCASTTNDPSEWHGYI